MTKLEAEVVTPTSTSDPEGPSEKFTRFTDASGNRLVAVRVSGSKTPAILDERCFDMLTAKGLTDHDWFLHETGNGFAYVKSRFQGRQVTIASQVAECFNDGDRIVRIEDRNPLNLRYSNLSIGSHRKKARPSKAVQTAPTPARPLPFPFPFQVQCGR